MQRVASDPGITPEKLRTAATLAMLLKGTPLIYYGQELGMRGAPRPEYKSDEKDIGDREAFEWSARTEAPGQANWYKGQKTYWTERFAKDNDAISVWEEERDPSSLLEHYRKLLELRRSHPALATGSQKVIETRPQLLTVERSGGGERLWIVANLSNQPANYRALDLLSGKSRNVLKPYEAIVIKD